MYGRAVFLAAAIILAPFGAQAADLVVWWEKGYYAQEDEAVREIIAAFEQDTGKQVELVSYSLDELPGKLEAALEAGKPPDFAFGILIDLSMSRWAFDDRLVDLTDAIGHFADLFDPDALTRWTLLNEKTGQKALYGLPMGQNANYVHVWKSLLEQAGFTLDDIPKPWDAFWAFWCDEAGGAPGRGPRRRLGRRFEHVGRDQRHAGSILSLPGCLRCGLRDPTRDRRPRGQAQAHRGDRRLHRGLP
jgi:multiple sugar transport system substrate-binding protein